ncbi:MAG: aminotransferase class I/II-fold pyridoxal phosphate-dependent enzyme, partial [Halanaerobacter sp.]
MSRKEGEYGFETLALHAGYNPQDDSNNSRAVPIYQSTSYTFADAEEAAAIFAGEEEGNIYTRIGNPTNDVLEERVAQLEGAEAGLVTSSGMSAIHLTALTLADGPGEIVSSQYIYGGTYHLFADTLTKYNINTTFVNPHDLEAWEEAISDDTKFLYLESPGNPTLDVVDIEAVAEIAKRHDLKLVVDNTFNSPYLSNPIDFG